jgi:hypothetical protein
MVHRLTQEIHMAKPTFTPRNPQGDALDPIEFTPLIYIVGTQTHRFALHREINRLPEPYREWTVSEPQLGMNLTRVHGQHMGMPVSSKGFTLKDARNAAMHSLDMLVERIGSDKFNARIASAKEALQAATA